VTLEQTPDAVPAAAAVPAAVPGMPPPVTPDVRLWQAFGLRPMGPDGTLTAEQSGLVTQFLSVTEHLGTDREGAVSMARAIGYHLNRLATQQVLGLSEELSQEGLGQGAVDRAAELYAEQGERLGEVMLKVWQRHLRRTAGWRTYEHGDVEPGEDLTLTVGFVDMVGYTAWSLTHGSRALSQLVRDFERIVTDVVYAEGGRIMKLSGDGVLYVTDRPDAGAAVALRLSRAVTRELGLLDVRAGVATGPVVATSGDVFGTPVNLASRLSHAAEIGTVLFDETTANATASRLPVDLYHRRMELPGIGSVVVASTSHPR
jgi:adenylate cyclase